MILSKPSYEILTINTNPLELIEVAGRVCYKSWANLTDDSAADFVRKTILPRGHESVIEHSMMSVMFIVDRGVSHELVRHRLCAFSQESTRYCNYKGGVAFIIPPWCTIPEGEHRIDLSLEPEEVTEDTIWLLAMARAEQAYITLINRGWPAQEARSVLPSSTKTCIVVTANFREWRHILTLRCSKASHPQMREVMLPLLAELKDKLPAIFENIGESKYGNNSTI